jgi:hypothetical protein
MASKTFEKNGSSYTFFTRKTLGKDTHLPETTVDSILKLYCREKFMTSGEIAIKLGIPKRRIEAVVRALKVNHKSVPFLDSDIEKKDDDALVGEMLDIRRHDIAIQYDKQVAQIDAEDALKWRMLVDGVLAPVEQYLKNWKPPIQKKITKYVPPKKSESVLCVGCSDWHYGLVANQRYLYNQKEWNMGKTIEAVGKYGDMLQNEIRTNPYKQINLMFLGDIAHSITGFTDKGTKLEVGALGEEQIDSALQSMLEFVEKILAVHNTIRVYACSGNHDSVSDYILLRMLEIYFRNDKRISFEITNKRHLTFKVFSNLFLMEHGYSAITKNRLPAMGKNRENYLNNLFMSKPELFQNSDRFYYCSADQHHSESYELTNIEGFLFPTLVGGCRYSDNSGYKSRPRQTCLVLTSRGVDEQKYFYFD